MRCTATYMFNLCGLYHKTYIITRIQPVNIVLDGT